MRLKQPLGQCAQVAELIFWDHARHRGVPAHDIYTSRSEIVSTCACDSHSDQTGECFAKTRQVGICGPSKRRKSAPMATTPLYVLLCTG